MFKIDSLLKFIKKKNEHIEGNGNIIIPRERERDILRRNRITRSRLEYLLKELSVEHYSKGPESDHNGTPGDLFIFGLMIDDTEYYVKLKFNGNDLIVLSFHPADFPIIYNWRLKEDENEYKVAI